MAFWAKGLSCMPAFAGCRLAQFTQRRQALHNQICKALVLAPAKAS